MQLILLTFSSGSLCLLAFQRLLIINFLVISLGKNRSNYWRFLINHINCLTIKPQLISLEPTAKIQQASDFIVFIWLLLWQWLMHHIGIHVLLACLIIILRVG